MISQETAAQIWNCHREIAVAKELEQNLNTALKEGKDPSPIDSWGDPADFTLGVPRGEKSHTLYKVAPRLALSVIRAHIAEKQAELVAANEQARIELTNPTLNNGQDAVASVTVNVNGEEFAWSMAEPDITYHGVVDLLRYKNDQFRDGLYSITYHRNTYNDFPNKQHGTLSPGQSVPVTDGMRFTAVITDNA